MSMLSRRHLLAGLSALGAGGAAFAGSRETAAPERLRAAYDARLAAARKLLAAGADEAPTNGDETAIPSRAAAYSKGLAHDTNGLVDAKAYTSLLDALATGEQTRLERVPLGGHRKLANPLGGLGPSLLGPDPIQLPTPPPPRLASEEQAGEMVELAWQALLRDVPFAHYDDHPDATAAAAELARFPTLSAGALDRSSPAAALFRGIVPSDRVGPYVSQFLLANVPMRPILVEQRIRTLAPGSDALTSWDAWLAAQNGQLTPPDRFDPERRHIRNGRDLAEYVHRDFSYQAFFCAAMQLLKWSTPIDGANPYKHSRTQAGFATFGEVDVLSLLGAVTDVALRACWYQKWQVHRRLRPEELGGRLELVRNRGGGIPLHPTLLDADVVARLESRFGGALLPQAYPEGCPLHPSYPAGHATIAGACVTILKAFFDESYAVPNPVEAAADGLSLVPWRGTLTVGGELDKLAANVAMGRNWAGIHWRTDATAGLAQGERAALGVLRELRATRPEQYGGFTVTTFSGDRVTI